MHLLLSEINTELEHRRRKKDELTASLVTVNNKIDSSEQLLSKNERAIVILQIASSMAKNHIKEKFETIVTDAIGVITGLDHEFKIDISTRGDDIEATFTIDDNPFILDSFGGGIADIVALVLRLLVMNMHQLDVPMLLDEPTKNLSKAHYSERISDMLKEFSKHRQLIVTTHSDELAGTAERLIRTKLIGGETKLEIEVRDEASGHYKR